MPILSESRRDTALFGEIAERFLKEGKTVRFAAHGRSMQPFVLDGDTVTVRPWSGKRLVAGTVVLHRRQGERLAAHRVISRRTAGGSSTYLVRGDASSGPCERVPAGDILGIVVGAQRHGRDLPLQRQRWLALARGHVRTGRALLSRTVHALKRPRRAAPGGPDRRA